MITAGVKDNQILEGFEAIAIEKERIDRFGFTQSELDRAKTSVLRSADKQVKEKDKQESGRLIWQLVSHYLNNNPLLDADQNYELTAELLNQISLEDVNQLIKEYSKEENRVITASHPKKAGIISPNKDELLALLDMANNMELEPYHDNFIDEPLLKDVIEPGTIISKKYNKTTDLYELYLSNGAKVIYKKTDFKNDEILFDSFSPGGLSQVSDHDLFNAQYACDYITSSGIGAFDRNALSKFLTGKNVRISPYMRNYYEGLTGSSSPEDIELFMQLIHAYFTQVRRDEIALNALISQYEGFLQNRMLNPEAVFDDSVEVYSYGNHPRVIIPTADNIKTLDLDKIIEIYNDRFADASKFTFFFVGSIDEKQIEDLSEKYIASLPSINRKEKKVNLKLDYIKGIHEYDIRSGIEEKSKVKISLTNNFSYSAQNWNNILTMNLILNEKLRENIREEMSGVYYIYAYPEERRYPKGELTIHIVLGCSPERVDELIEAIYHEIDLMKTNLPEEKYMVISQQTMVQSLSTSIKRNNYWINNLKNCYQTNTDPKHFINNMDYINAVKDKDVRKAARKYLNYEKDRLRFVLYPEK